MIMSNKPVNLFIFLYYNTYYWATKINVMRNLVFLSIALGLYAGEGAVPGYAAMTDVEWSATPAWPGGATKTLNGATGSVSIEGPPPGGGGPSSIRADCRAPCQD